MDVTLFIWAYSFSGLVGSFVGEARRVRHRSLCVRPNCGKMGWMDVNMNYDVMVEEE